VVNGKQVCIEGGAERVLDVAPRGTVTDGFTGRLWVEDRNFNIVRFNGIIRGLPGNEKSGKKFWFNVDSWRANVKPALWLPSYVYSEQHTEEGAKIKSQMRLWGYDLKSTKPTQEFTTITIDEPSVQDKTEQPQQLSPTLSQRMWDQQAEENVVDRLTKAGLLAPTGEVDKVLETVATNLQITNNLTILLSADAAVHSPASCVAATRPARPIARNRRFPVIDTELGIVVSFVLVDFHPAPHIDRPDCGTFYMAGLFKISDDICRQCVPRRHFDLLVRLIT